MKRAIAFLPLALMAGCGSISGLDAKSSFSCKAPDGVLCQSMTGIYANGMQNNLPAQRAAMHEDADAPKDPDLSRAKEGQSVMTKPLYSGSPIRTAPKVIRVWFAPWEDTDGDLHDQAYVYLPIDTGRWQIEHNRRRIVDAYRPVRAPVNVQPNQISKANQAQLKNAGRAQLPQQQSQGDVEEIGVNQGSKSFGQMATDILKGMVTPSGSGDKE